MATVDYAELHCLSNFTFLRGASRPEELVERATELGYAGLALTDECSVAGVVRAHVAARGRAPKLVIGSEFAATDGLKVVVLAPDRAAYGALCNLISSARQATAKGKYRIERDDIARCLTGSACLVLWLPGELPDIEAGAWLNERFGGRVWLAVELSANGRDRELLARLLDNAARLGMPARHQH